MERVIEVKNLWKVYEDGTRALKGVDLEVREGEFVGLMGPSGSGKSTLLHLIGGLDHATEGEVKVFGEDVTRMGEDELADFRKGRIAYVFQFYYLLEDFNVLENLLIVADLLGIENAQAKAEDILERLRLSHRITHKPYQLSGGEQQRVAIARAIISEPSLILADEPTGNIDWEEGRKIFQLFKSLNSEKGITFVVATHNPDLGEFFDRVVRLKDGSIAHR